MNEQTTGLIKYVVTLIAGVIVIIKVPAVLTVLFFIALLYMLFF